MYRTILIPVENSPADQTILDHIKPLARMTGASLLLMHVADGWVARNFEQLNLAESEEIKMDRAYLEQPRRGAARRRLYRRLRAGDGRALGRDHQVRPRPQR